MVTRNACGGRICQTLPKTPKARLTYFYMGIQRTLTISLFLKYFALINKVDGKREKEFAPLALYRNRETGEIKWRCVCLKPTVIWIK